MLAHKVFIISKNQDRKIRTAHIQDSLMACVKTDWCEIVKALNEKNPPM